MALTPSASYSLTVRAAIKNRPGMLGLVTSAIGGAAGDIRAVDLVELVKDIILRDLTSSARDEAHGHDIVEYVIPSVFNKKVGSAAAREVVRAAPRGGLGRRRRRSSH